MFDSAGAPPNVLVVLFDCLRAEDFPGGADEVAGMPFARQLMGESYVFPRAISPAPWTIPSHASLFTGLYPWESGVHAYHSLMSPPTLPRVPGILHTQGYRSLSLSANPFLSPRFGLVDGFDTAEWGGWWEQFFRTPRSSAPNVFEGGTETTAQARDKTMEWLRDGPLGDVLRSASQHSYRFPYALDGGSRFLHRFRFPGTQRPLSVTPWLEPALAEWLARQPRDHPVFCFLNLTDTHEPYYPDPALVHGLQQWWSFTRVRQDHANAVAGEWEPTPTECRQLRELYRMMVRHLDLRLQNIVEVFRAAGRWDNTVLAVTSDHGQALGEHGMMFHLLRLDEPLLRIPLWLRPPRGDGGGHRAVGWANLVDLAPTLLGAARAPFDPFPSARSLESVLDRPRPDPVFAMSDGIVWPHIRERFSAERARLWDRPFVAAYRDDLKVVASPSDQETHAYDIARDPRETNDLWPSKDARVVTLLDEVRRVGARLLGGQDSVEAGVEERLRSWGYL